MLSILPIEKLISHTNLEMYDSLYSREIFLISITIKNQVGKIIHLNQKCKSSWFGAKKKVGFLVQDELRVSLLPFFEHLNVYNLWNRLRRKFIELIGKVWPLLLFFFPSSLKVGPFSHLKGTFRHISALF